MTNTHTFTVPNFKGYIAVTPTDFSILSKAESKEEIRKIITTYREKYGVLDNKDWITGDMRIKAFASLGYIVLERPE